MQIIIQHVLHCFNSLLYKVGMVKTPPPGAYCGWNELVHGKPLAYNMARIQYITTQTITVVVVLNTSMSQTLRTLWVPFHWIHINTLWEQRLRGTSLSSSLLELRGAGCSAWGHRAGEQQDRNPGWCSSNTCTLLTSPRRESSGPQQGNQFVQYFITRDCRYVIKISKTMA